MRLPLAAPPASIARRLLVFSIGFVTLSLVVAGVILWFVLQSVMREQIDQRLDGQISAIEGALNWDARGRLLLDAMLDGPPFDRPGSGWAWQVESGGQRLASPSLADRRIAVPSAGRDGPRASGDRSRPADIMDDRGRRQHLRIATREIDGVPVVILAAAPLAALVDPALQALSWLAPCMLVLGVVLLAGTFLQVRFGLKPLTAMAVDLGAVEQGALARLPDQPTAELAPLAGRINALIVQNEDRLAASRLHFANLAHGLKTPVASLVLALDARNDPDGELRALLGRIDQRIRHHLTAARRATGGTSFGTRTALAPSVEDIAAIMARIHADRRIAFQSRVEGHLAVACETRDVEEMLGNLIDNAFKWAGAKVAVSAFALTAVNGFAPMIRIEIEDDGPGLRPDRLEAVLLPGIREDERVPGDGFGLTIVKELTDLYAGTLRLEPREPHGLRAVLCLPAAAAPGVGT